MGELQLAGLLMLLGSLPVYLLANHIERNRHWTLFSGWDPTKITDCDAYGSMLCKGLRGSSAMMTVLGITLFLFNPRGQLFVFGGLGVTLAPLIYYTARAKARYGK